MYSDITVDVRTPTCPRQASSLLLFGCLRACLWPNASYCHQTLLSQLFPCPWEFSFCAIPGCPGLQLWSSNLMDKERERKRQRTGWTSPDKMSTKVTDQERRQEKVYKAAFFWVRQSHEWSWDFLGFCVIVSPLIKVKTVSWIVSLCQRLSFDICCFQVEEIFQDWWVELCGITTLRSDSCNSPKFSYFTHIVTFSCFNLLWVFFFFDNSKLVKMRVSFSLLGFYSQVCVNNRFPSSFVTLDRNCLAVKIQPHECSLFIPYYKSLNTTSVLHPWTSGYQALEVVLLCSLIRGKSGEWLWNDA